MRLLEEQLRFKPIGEIGDEPKDRKEGGPEG
jgi:hypothetical protein